MATAAQLDALLQAQTTAQSCGSLPELAFAIVNGTQAVVPYQQALLWRREASDPGSAVELLSASGLVSIEADAPFAVWLRRFARDLPTRAEPLALQRGQGDPEHAQDWVEWLPDHLLLVPLTAPDGRVLAQVLYAAALPWHPHAIALMQRLHAGYAHAWSALSPRPSRWRRAWRTRPLRWVLATAALACLAWPVHLSVLAPAEVIALSAQAIAAPQDGVIGAVAVAPSARVRQGDLLFSLDDSTLLNRQRVAREALAVARADALVAQQRAFDDDKGRADVALALGRAREKEAELASIDTQARRVEVRALRDGIALFGDANDWIGRPVQTGERVMQLAQPQDAGVLVWLSVGDAITLPEQTRVRLFLHTDPLNPRDAIMEQVSHLANPGPDGVAAYRLRARLVAEDGPAPRIGLRGTARLSGERVPLAYVLLRRPLAALRAWTGF